MCVMKLLYPLSNKLNLNLIKIMTLKMKLKNINNQWSPRGHTYCGPSIVTSRTLLPDHFPSFTKSDHVGAHEAPPPAARQSERPPSRSYK